MAHIYAVGLGSVDIFMHMEENFTLVMDNAPINAKPHYPPPGQ